MKRTAMKRKKPTPYANTTKEWCASWEACWRCGKRGTYPKVLCCHHIVCGTSKQLDALQTLACLCHECHTKEHFTMDHLGLHGMLALKRHFDAAYYDLAFVCQARGRAGSSITEQEVSEAASKLFGKSP
jgi:hypothetical protein